MLKNVDNSFLRISFRFYHGGFCAVIPTNVARTYEILSVFAWRDPSNKDPLMASRYRKLQLVSRVNQKKIADMLGVQLRAVKGYIAQLKALGWIRIEELGNTGKGHSIIYHLGFCEADDDGQVTENLYADSHIGAVWVAMEKEAQRKTKNPQATFKALSVAERVTFVRTHLHLPEFAPDTSK